MDEPLAEIRVVLLPDGQVHICSTCAGQPDSSYAPCPDAQASTEVDDLVGELRARLGGREFVVKPARPVSRLLISGPGADRAKAVRKAVVRRPK